MYLNESNLILKLRYFTEFENFAFYLMFPFSLLFDAFENKNTKGDACVPYVIFLYDHKNLKITQEIFYRIWARLHLWNNFLLIFLFSEESHRSPFSLNPWKKVVNRDWYVNFRNVLGKFVPSSLILSCFLWNCPKLNVYIFLFFYILVLFSIQTLNLN